MKTKAEVSSNYFFQKYRKTNESHRILVTVPNAA
jgi:hypothetical protein